MHNEVNKSLGKEIFDCSKIGDFYDCGCADDEAEGNGEGKGGAVEKEEMSEEEKEKESVTGSNGRDMNDGKVLHAANAGLGVGVG